LGLADHATRNYGEGCDPDMSTPAKIYLEADAGRGVRRERDKADDARRMFLNFICSQCHTYVIFNRCDVGDDGECALDQIRMELQRAE